MSVVLQVFDSYENRMTFAHDCKRWYCMESGGQGYDFSYSLFVN